MITAFGADTLSGAHSTPSEMWTEEYQLEFLMHGAYLPSVTLNGYVPSN